MRPGSGRLDLGLTMRGTRESGILGGMLSYDHRIDPRWALTAEATGGLQWQGKRWDPYAEAMIGVRGVW